MIQTIKTILSGFVMALANVIPGVSGGTMAVIMGIYDKVIGLFAVDLKAIKRDWKFYIWLLLGMGVGMIVFARLITALLESYPMPTCFFFIGLIFGSLPLLWKQTVPKGRKLPTVTGFLLIAAAIAVMYLLTLIGDNDGMAAATQFEIGLAVKLFFGAIIAAAAMVVPGVSGSSLLVAFGMFTTFYGAVGDLNIPLLIPIGMGVVMGLILGARLMRLVMKRWPVPTYCVIVGLVIGSLFEVYPGFTFDLMGLISVVTLAAGAVVAYLFSKDGE